MIPLVESFLTRILTQITRQMSEHESELSDAPTNPSNPFSKAKGVVTAAPSTVSSRIAGRTRHRDQRRGIVQPKPSKTLAPQGSDDLDVNQASLARIPTGIQEQESNYGNSGCFDDFEDPDASDADNELPNTQEEALHSSQTSTRQKRARVKTSIIHSQVIEVFENGVARWRCKHCGKKYDVRGGTTNVKKHLIARHQWVPNADRQTLKRQRQNVSLTEALARQGEVSAEKNERRRIQLLNDGIDKTMLEFLYIKWTIKSNIPFIQVQNHDFRVFLEYLNPVANSKLPESHTTIQDRIMKLYNNTKDQVGCQLREAISDIHFTCDLWTSPNHLALLGINAYFTSENLTLQTSTIALRELKAAHSGANMAQIFWDVLNEYRITNKAGYWVMDNDSRNDMLLKELSPRFHRRNIHFDPERQWLRCNGHIINLAVQAFLFMKSTDDVDYIEVDADRPDLVLPSDDALNKWRKFGPLGKLHNIVVYISMTPQRINTFLRLSDDLHLIRDNATRWNSWFLMLDRVLERTKGAVTQFVANERELNDNMTGRRSHLYETS